MIDYKKISDWSDTAAAVLMLLIVAATVLWGIVAWFLLVLPKAWETWTGMGFWSLFTMWGLGMILILAAAFFKACDD